MADRRIVAMGGGGFSMEPDDPLLDGFVLSLARAAATPRVCFLATASGDAEGYVAGFYRAFSRLDCAATDLQLFERSVGDLETFVLEQDVIYVGGGNTANMLAVWRTHGLDRVLRDAWEQGVVLCGQSAGMNCWFEQCVTDSFGRERLTFLRDGLGLLAGSACPHYDSEAERRPTFERLVASGELSDGWAADDGAALVFHGDEMAAAVSSRPDAGAYRVTRSESGGVDEEALVVRYLGG